MTQITLAVSETLAERLADVSVALIAWIALTLGER
jgi:hypothetical protein